jgi:DNA-binding transcriptional regulator PaaX
MVRYKGIKIDALGLPVLSDAKKKSKAASVKRNYNVSFSSPFKRNATKDLIVMYDIPHELKRERDWFRRQLINFGYEMVQKSVWIGPSPLPKDFLAYLKRIKIRDKFKTFRLSKKHL